MILLRSDVLIDPDSPMRLETALVLVLCSAALLHACHQEAAVEDHDTTSSAPKGDDGDLSALFTSPPKESGEEIVKRYIRRKNSVPITARQYREASDAAMELNDYDAAEMLASKSIELDPDNARGYLLRGKARCNSTDGKYEDALADLRIARDLGLRKTDLYATEAKINDSLGRTQDAIDALSEGIVHFPGSKKLYKTRASLNLALGKTDETMKDYNKLLEIDPRDSLCRILRGQLHESTGENEAALEDYELAARPDRKEGKIPKRPVALKFRAILLDKLGRHQEAVADLTAALELDRQDDEVRRLRAVQYIALKKFDLALADLNRAIENGPEFAQQAYLDRATVYELTGKTDLAQQDRQSASRLKKKPAERPLFELKDSQ